MLSSLPRCVACLATVLGFATFANTVTLADVFDDHSTYWIKQATEKAPSLASLSMKDGSKIKPLGRRLSSPCLVFKTDDDNWTKALITWGFRKTKTGMTPVLIIERFVTYRSDRPNLTTAVGKDVMLFPGFAYNFDIGQVVPGGQGEDIKCGADALLEVVEPAKMYALNGSALPEPAAAAQPNPAAREEVFPSDFAGKWRVRIDGRWEGLWDLKVDERRVFGKFISDGTQSEYEINGRIAGLAHNLKMDIELANTSQSIDAFLWTKDKSAMAGTVVIAERKVGFYALREKADE